MFHDCRSECEKAHGTGEGSPSVYLGIRVLRDCVQAIASIP